MVACLPVERRPKLGYYKQQEIAQQLEVADRVPRPRPASSHVTLQIRRREMRKASRDYTGLMVLGGMCVMFVLGVMIGVMA
jgi:RecA/RadA recombinase